MFEVPSGSTNITTLISFNGADGAEPVDALTLDAMGNLYGTTEKGGDASGSAGYGTVFEVAAGSGAITTLATFTSNGYEPMGGVTLDASGNLYGTTTAGGISSMSRNLGTAYELPKGSNTVTTLAYFNGTDGASPEAGLTIDAAGNLFGTTRGGGARPMEHCLRSPRGLPSLRPLSPSTAPTGRTPSPL